MRKERRERIEKGSREGIEKETIGREGGPERPSLIRIFRSEENQIQRLS